VDDDLPVLGADVDSRELGAESVCSTSDEFGWHPEDEVPPAATGDLLDRLWQRTESLQQACETVVTASV
jgi:hypothetical protein